MHAIKSGIDWFINAFEPPEAFREFTAEKNRLRHLENGVLEFAGFRWPQLRPERLHNITGTYLTLSGVMGVAGLVMYLKHSTFFPAALGGYIVVMTILYLSETIKAQWLFVGGCVFRRFYRPRDNSDRPEGGHIYVKRPPVWFVGWAGNPWIELRHKAQDITSIETMPMRNMGGGHFKTRMFGMGEFFGYEVALFFTTGEVFHVAQYIDESTARVVTTQLNQALSELRRAYAQ